MNRPGQLPVLAPGSGPEFPEGADQLSGVDRRDFLRLLGASLALAGAGGCASPPEKKIVPYHRRPPELTPGNALHYATATLLDGYATGLVVSSREGRPVKVEGNPEHPDSLGAAGALEQAELLQLYDPDRARQLKHRGQPVAREGLFEQLSERAGRLAEKGGEGLYFLLEPTSSPLLTSLRQRILQRFPKAQLLSYAPLSEESRHLGARAAFGKPAEAVYDFRRARVVLAFDDDFLEARGRRLAWARGFAERRRPGPEMNRLYVVEPCPTVTGMAADHRLRARGSEVFPLACLFLEKLHATGAVPMLSSLVEAARAHSGGSEKATHFLEVAARDAAASSGQVLVLAGARQPPALHALAQAINVALGSAEGETPAVRYLPPPVADLETGPEVLRRLAGEIAHGRVDTLVITSRNPAYAGFAEADLHSLLPKVPESIYLSLFEDETAARCSWVVPALHPLESWGDGKASDGTVTLIQPLTRPLVPGVAEAELLAALAGQRGSAYELLRDRWREGREVASFDHSWESWLREGLLQGSAESPISPELELEGVARTLRELTRTSQEAGGLELAFAQDYKVHDGRFANNAWLQELPDPVTKLCWDNAALLSPATAASLGLKTGDLVRLRSRGQEVQAPVYLLPGHVDGALTLPLGYGREGGEKTARGVGFNAYRLRHSDAPWFQAGASVEKVGHRPLANAQPHGSMEGRPLALEVELAKLPDSEGELEAQRSQSPTLHPPKDYSGEEYRWAMAVDLNSCVGCGACVLACQAENNIPVVGRENVLKSREMHWLRVDRYFQGDLEEPRAVNQPLACVHCEAAPCEYVCPVNATVHSDEGLNQMVYNRCIGTRYCSNNCPYKVRRFNFLAYNDRRSEGEKLVLNPDVTVRARGVMEKCTYCVQRIERARIEAHREGRKIGEGELVTACQQACPTKAISFGSLHDPDSQVSRLHRDPRRYDLLHELGTRPRTAYLVRVRNPNTELG